METVGTSVPRLDAIEKVTGRATYVGDIKRSGMLHATILPSPIPRARITAIDTTATQQLPGVVAVLTREHLHDIDPYYGSTIRDRPIVAIDKVRYQGEPVAAIAAVDERTAQQALELIEVTYEELPSAPSPARHQPQRNCNSLKAAAIQHALGEGHRALAARLRWHRCQAQALRQKSSHSCAPPPQPCGPLRGACSA